ncbi:MAG: amidase, partial [Sphingomonas sp.]
VGVDPADPATRESQGHIHDFAAPLAAASLKGVRVAVLRPEMPDALKRHYETTLEVLKAQGAVLVDADMPKLDGIGEAELLVLQTELKADLDTYLATTPKTVTTRTLDQVIAFNAANAAAEMPFFEQETFVAAAKTRGLADPEYLGARAKSLRLAGAEGIDAVLAKAQATLIVAPTYGMPWLSDTVYGDNFNGPSASELPAISGYPHLTVPMGLVRGVPVGLSFIATRWADQAVLNAGYVFEQAAKARVVPKYLPTNDAGPGLGGAR